MKIVLITKKEIKEIIIRGPFCISILIPKHWIGEADFVEEDALELKNQLKAIKKKLRQESLSTAEIKNFVALIKVLIDYGEFGRLQSNGLTMFLADGFYCKFALPIHFEAFNHLATGFYLEPLVPIFIGDGLFFIPALGLVKVNICLMKRYTISNVIIEDLIQAQIVERIGNEYKQKFLQFTIHQKEDGSTVFHGYKEVDRNRNSEISRYFKSIDKGLMTILNDETQPMIVVCRDYQFHIYKKVSSYKHLLDVHILSNPSCVDKYQLHELAWKRMEHIFNKERQDKDIKFKQFDDMGKASSNLKQVIPVLIQEKSDALFVEKRVDIWGIYNPVTQYKEIHEEFKSPCTSVLNKPVIQTYLNCGNLYLLEKDEMLSPCSKVYANHGN